LGNNEFFENLQTIEENLIIYFSKPYCECGILKGLSANYKKQNSIFTIAIKFIF